VVVSRQVVIDSKFSTVVCAPIYSKHDGLASQVAVGMEEGLKQMSGIHCDELVSLPKNRLTNYIGKLSHSQVEELNQALMIALDLEEDILI
jgi:mRNA interferase MazF